MHSRGHRSGAARPRLWSSTLERGQIHSLERRSADQTHRLSDSQDAALRRRVGATPEEPFDAQGRRADSRHRAPRNSLRGDHDMSRPHDYDDIPGTYVYDAERGRIGYPLNMFCMSLNQLENRKRFKADPAAYLDGFPLNPEQRRDRKSVV